MASDRVKEILESIQIDNISDTTANSKILQTRLRDIVAEMENGLIERSTEIRLLLLAVISREHVFFIGPPGTAKSELGRRLSRVCKGSYFERLLTRFSVPEELFGPLSMRALEEDQYVRQISGYLPDSQVAFIDEIFKANSAILNTLLTLLNERAFDNGNYRCRVPLICLVGASNELPESEELDALYDRFLFRKKVNQVSAKGFSNMISRDKKTTDMSKKDNNLPQDSPHEIINSKSSTGHVYARATSITLVDDDILFSLRSEAQRHVLITDQVINLITDIRDFMQTKIEPPVYISDRRLVKAVNMLKVVAYSNGRTQISPFDCLLLQHCLWHKPEEQEYLLEFLLDKLSADEEVPNFEIIMQRIFARSCLVLTGATADQSLKTDLNSVQKEVVLRLEQITSTFTEALPILTENVWISPEEASSLSSVIGPKTIKTKKHLEGLLLETEILKVILNTGKEPSICAELLGTRWADFLKTPLKLKEN